MPAQRILFVKLSSLGDVVHHMPAVTDLQAHRPGVRIGWAVEDAYQPLVALHPAVAEIFPVGLRGLRKHPFERARWKRLAAVRGALRRQSWDYVVDTQGLLKSAIVTRCARGRVAAGPDLASAREGIAALFYDRRVEVPRQMHAVERNRRLVAGVFGYRVEGPARYELAHPPMPPLWAPRGPYAVLLHAASRDDKRWPEQNWIALAQRLAAEGYATVFPGGTEAERMASARLALMVPGAMAAPAMDLGAAAALIAHASLVAGVDTGLTHLAVAFDRPTVGIYSATRPELTGLHGENGTNLGGPGHSPTVDAVAAALGLAPAR